ncbi:MAG: hypothetical protein SV375_01860 [Thermodesulfobacteriota bacterium]|nr:hypothetical protein [Thermodesulfobacteriota bacterium]
MPAIEAILWTIKVTAWVCTGFMAQSMAARMAMGYEFEAYFDLNDGRFNV